MKTIMFKGRYQLVLLLIFVGIGPQQNSASFLKKARKAFGNVKLPLFNKRLQLTAMIEKVDDRVDVLNDTFIAMKRTIEDLKAQLAALKPQRKPGCQRGFIKNADSCYWFSKDSGTFSECTATCLFLGSQLAAITSQEEDMFIQGVLKYYKTGYDYYVGGTKWRLGWTWENPIGSFEYMNFRPNEPTNVGDAEHCLAVGSNIVNGTNWFDTLCSEKLHCICETQAGPRRKP